MNPRKKIIQWSPHEPNCFVIGSNDLRLYEVKSKSVDAIPINKNSNAVESLQGNANTRDKVISLIGVNSEVQNLKCLEWSPEDVRLIAVGLATGKVALANFDIQQQQATSRRTKVFVPKHQRSCNALAWNPVQKNLLAAGLDKVRSDYSCLVWDITQPGIVSFEGSQQQEVDPNTVGTSITNEPVTSSVSSAFKSDTFNVLSVTYAVERVEKPMRELANSEATMSLAWLPEDSFSLATGTGTKWMRIYDLRVPYRAPTSVVAHTKAVYGVTFDRFRPQRLATFSEDNVIKIWDIRKLKDPVLVLNTNSKGLLQLEWCPTRAGILAVISKDEPNIKIWDVRDAFAQLSPTKESSSEAAAATEALTKPSRIVEMSEPISSFSWNPHAEYKLIHITYSGNVEIVNLHESIPLSFSPKCDFAVADGKKMFEGSLLPVFVSLAVTESNSATTTSLSSQDKTLKETAITGNNIDISVVMYERTQQGYASDIKTNRDLANKFSDTQIKFIWDWLHYMKINFNVGKAGDIKGIYSIIQESMTPSKCEVEKSPFEKIPVYKSEERTLCQRMCGWTFATASQLDEKISQLEEESQHEKAAAFSVFHFDLKRAIQSLNRAVTKDETQSEMMKFIAMALAGYGSGSEQLWKETCSPLIRRLRETNPYISAIFAFLCNADVSEYGAILRNPKIALNDKIAFGCRFLSDDQFKNYLESERRQVIKDGNLQGLIVTGLDSSLHGVDLLQNYINNTADIQTACLILSHISPRKVKDPRINKWISIYRDLLDRWQLWKERARFDVARGPFIDLKPPPQVFARCNFCSQSFTMRSDSRSAKPITSRPLTQIQSRSTINANPAKISACFHCKKPLPRCALCLLPLNVTSPDSKNVQTVDGTYWHSGRNDFDRWFTWCQTCKHGGHAGHMLEWFETHTECPVSDCHCKCLLEK
jgi:WD40 repeat protein